MTHRNQQKLATQAAAEPCRGGALPRRLLTGSCPPPARPRPASRENVEHTAPEKVRAPDQSTISSERT